MAPRTATPCGQGGIHHRGEALDACNAAVDVLLAEGLAGGAEDDDLVGLSSTAASQPFRLGVEHASSARRPARHAAHHRMVVGHLRHPFG